MSFILIPFGIRLYTLIELYAILTRMIIYVISLSHEYDNKSIKILISALLCTTIFSKQIRTRRYGTKKRPN